MAADHASAFGKLLKDLAEQHSEDIEEAVRRVKADLGRQVARNHAVSSAGWEDPSLRGTVLQRSGVHGQKHALNAKSRAFPNESNEIDELETQDGNDLPGSVPAAKTWIEPPPPPPIDPKLVNDRRSASSSIDPKARRSSLQVARDLVMADSSWNVRMKKGDENDQPSIDCVSKFVQSPMFTWISAGLLLANAVFIGIQVECGFEVQVPVEVQAIDIVFCVCFLVELGLRLWGFGCHRFWFDRGERAWNIFDFTIVMTSTFDTTISNISRADSALGNISAVRVIRVVRIVRVLRIIRVMKFFADLRKLLAAIVSTIKTAGFAFVLISFIIYMFAIAITQLVAEFVKDQQASNNTPEHEIDLMFYFGGIFPSMFTLFMTISAGIDWKDAAVPLFDVSHMAITCFLLYIAVMIFCVMNVLLGIFCQCALDTAAVDKENVIQLQLQDKHRFVETLKELFAGWDEDGNGQCSLEEFQKHLMDETTQALLRSLEIESRDAITLFKLLDVDGSGEVDLHEFVTGCITLRGGAKAIHIEKLSMMNQAFDAKLQMLESKFEGFNNNERLRSSEAIRQSLKAKQSRRPSDLR